MEGGVIVYFSVRGNNFALVIKSYSLKGEQMKSLKLVLIAIFVLAALTLTACSEGVTDVTDDGLTDVHKIYGYVTSSPSKNTTVNLYNGMSMIPIDTTQVVAPETYYQFKPGSGTYRVEAVAGNNTVSTDIFYWDATYDIRKDLDF